LITGPKKKTETGSISLSPLSRAVLNGIEDVEIEKNLSIPPYCLIIKSVINQADRLKVEGL